MLSMQVITQVAYASDGDLAPAAPTTACLSVGFCALLAFSDYKMRTTPEVLPADYYGIGDSHEKVDGWMPRETRRRRSTLLRT